MITLKKIDLIETKYVALLVGAEETPSELPNIVQESLEIFKSNDEKFETVQWANHAYFLIKEETDLEKMRVAGHSLRKKLNKNVEEITLCGSGEVLLALAEGLALSNYQFLKYFKDADKKRFHLQNIFLSGAVEEARVKEMNHTIQAVCWARDMVNEPHSYLNATTFSEEMKKLANSSTLRVEVLDKKKIEELEMGGLLAVNKGSVQPPTFTILEHKPAQPINKKPIVLVGKGVVYDTGGLSLKPTPNSMDLMKSDMGGAAMMAGAIYAAALNEINIHIIALIPATDNRPGLDAYAPGDVIRMYDGTTVEVLNTDAEGRMILADAIAYAKKYDPELIINGATLTGAALIAVGTRAACMMSNASEQVNQSLVQAGERVYERMVQLPLWDDYKEQLKSSIADMKNIGGRTAGTITAGKFLEHFAEAPFVHIDIAGPAFNESEQNYKGNGGSGFGVRMLMEFFKKH